MAGLRLGARAGLDGYQVSGIRLTTSAFYRISAAS